MFKKSRKGANRALLSKMWSKRFSPWFILMWFLVYYTNRFTIRVEVTDGYNHPSVSTSDIKYRVSDLQEENVNLHAIARTHLTRKTNDTLNPSAREEKSHSFPFGFSRSRDFFGQKFLVDWKASSKHCPLKHLDFATIVKCREKAKGKIVTVIPVSRRPPKG